MSKSRILLAGAALFVTLICWSLSSPVNSHGDERYYIGSIWCANGYDENCLPLGRTKDNTEVASVNLGLCTPIGIEETYLFILSPSPQYFLWCFPPLQPCQRAPASEMNNHLPSPHPYPEAYKHNSTSPLYRWGNKICHTQGQPYRSFSFLTRQLP